MRILWLSWRDIKNPTGGGAEKVAIEVASRLAQEGHKVTLFSSSFENSKSEQTIRKVRVIRRGNLLTCRFFASLFYLRNKNDFDLIVDEINTIPFFTICYARKKSLVFIHQLARKYWFTQTAFPLGLLGYLLEPVFLRLYSNVPTITVSNSTKSDLLALGFKNINVVREGLNLLPRMGDKKREFVVFLGRLTKAKGPQDAINAFAIIKKSFPTFRLLVAGRGNKKYLKGLYKLTKELGLEKSVDFLGFITEKEKVGLLSKSKLALIPSIREGWGLVATEASAYGCVPVGYDVAGLRDSICQNYTGILTQPDYLHLAKSSIYLLGNEKKLKTLSINGYKDGKKYSWEKSFKDFKKILERNFPDTFFA